MKKENKDKIAFVCFLAASICYFVSAIIGILSDGESNYILNLCLGSAFLILSFSHTGNDKNDKK